MKPNAHSLLCQWPKHPCGCGGLKRSAGPDLYDACLAALQYLEAEAPKMHDGFDLPPFDQLRKALAKADGE